MPALSLSCLLVSAPSPAPPLPVQATGPFLHIGALVAATALSWIVAGQVARTERTSTSKRESKKATVPPFIGQGGSVVND